MENPMSLCAKGLREREGRGTTLAMLLGVRRDREGRNALTPGMGGQPTGWRMEGERHRSPNPYPGR